MENFYNNMPTLVVVDVEEVSGGPLLLEATSMGYSFVHRDGRFFLLCRVAAALAEFVRVTISTTEFYYDDDTLGSRRNTHKTNTEATTSYNS